MSSIIAEASSDAFQGSTVNELREYLSERGVDTAPFGSSPFKSLECLLKEIKEGESLLSTVSGGCPLRRVSVISVNIKNNKGLSLFETEQRLPSGSVRRRNLFLSEKMLPNESWEHATRRGILEELGSILPENPDICLLDDTYCKITETKESSSYPGLKTQYECHKVEARVSGLPDDDFETQEERPNGILYSNWGWRHA